MHVASPAAHAHTTWRRATGAFLLCELLCALLLLSACGSREQSARNEQFFAFGTLVEISLYGVDDEAAQRALGAAQSSFQHMHKAWHPWSPGELTELNHALSAGKPTTVSEELAALLATAKTLSQQSDGLFNPALGGLITLWGFHGDDAPAGPPPSARAIRTELDKNAGMDDLQLQETSVRSTNHAMHLDLGAVAKGYGVDRVVELLRDLGIDNLIVNAGGDLRVLGSHGQRPWRIGIRDPRGPGVLASVELESGESVFTSGDYERFFLYADRRYHHILDPRSGYPAMDTISVTVIHDDAAVADAAATALFVAGPEHWHEVARKMGLRHIMLVDQSGLVHMSPAMAQRIHFEQDPPPQVQVSASL